MIFGLKEYVIAISITLLQFVIALVLFRRRMNREFPFFLSYVCYHFFQGVVETIEMAVQASVATYFYTFYALQVFSLALSLAVIYEVFSAVLGPYEGFNRVWRKVFGAVSLVLCVVGGLWIMTAQGADTNRLVALFYLSERSLRVVQLGLIVFLFALSRAFGMTWRNYAFGIALGYGVYAGVDLLLVAMRTQYGQAILSLQSLATTTAYGVGNLIWLLYAVQTERPADLPRTVPYNDIAKWNEKLEEVLRAQGCQENRRRRRRKRRPACF